MKRYTAILLTIVVFGCAPARHRAYTCQAIRAQAIAVEASSVDVRAACAKIESALTREGIPILEDASTALESIKLSAKRSEKRCENVAARVAILEMDLGMPSDVPVVELGSSEDDQMTVEHAGIAIIRNSRRVWWNKLPAETAAALAETAGAMAGAMGTVVIEQVADRVPWWVRWTIWGAVGCAAVWALLTAWIWLRKRWYELGLAKMVKVAHENNVPKSALRDATEGGAAQLVYRKLRKRGELKDGSRSSDASNVYTNDA